MKELKIERHVLTSAVGLLDHFKLLGSYTIGEWDGCGIKTSLQYSLKCFSIIPCWSGCTKWAKCPFTWLARMVGKKVAIASGSRCCQKL